MRVTAGKLYRYYPSMTDVVDSRTALKFGDVVRVVELSNPAGHCHVADPVSGNFIGLVCCESLRPATGISLVRV
jgi:hypothetical protein